MSTMKTPRRLMLGLLSAGLVALLMSCGGSVSGSASNVGLGTGTAIGGDGPGGTGTGGDSTGSGTGGSGDTASNGNTDGSGVGSGGTGVTADAAGIGAADGLGSIILNGLRYDTASATLTLEDATELQIGMSARVAGKVDPDFTRGIATQVV